MGTSECPGAVPHHGALWGHQMEGGSALLWALKSPDCPMDPEPLHLPPPAQALWGCQAEGTPQIQLPRGAAWMAVCSRGTVSLYLSVPQMSVPSQGTLPSPCCAAAPPVSAPRVGSVSPQAAGALDPPGAALRSSCAGTAAAPGVA